MIVLIAIGYLILILLVLLLMVLFIPFNYLFEARKYDDALIRFRVSWLKGLAGFFYIKALNRKACMYISLFGLKIGINAKGKAREEKVEEKEHKENNLQDFLDLDFLKCLIDSLKKILKHIKPKKFILKGRIGFEDPYYTGTVCALTNIFYTQLQDASIKIETVFDDEVIEGECLVQGRIALVVIAYIALRLYLSRPVRIKQKVKPKIKEVKSYGG
ncbi:MAG: DUF2953 domain-containing protein [Bacillota bacterium]